MIRTNELVFADEKLHTVESIRDITESTYVLRLKRRNINFKAGNYIVLGLKSNTLRREYSIYSGEKDPYLEVLIRELPDGDVSRLLRKAKTGDLIHIEGPRGFFNLPEEKIANGKFVFIATGTGISPFHSFIKSNPAINYTLIHGVRFATEAYDSDQYDPSRYILCTSKDSYGTFTGRVTEYIEKFPFSKDSICFLCGNSNMIFEAYDILKKQGVPMANIYTEVYF